MRAHPTKSELYASHLLQSRYKFLSQVIFGYYIIDFVIPSKLLAVEIDGSSHIGKESYDLQRDIYIRTHGLSVVHVRNEDLHTLISVIESVPDVVSPSNSWKNVYALANSMHKIKPCAKQKSAPWKKKAQKRKKLGRGRDK